jgi:hypothetical protein
MVSVPSDILHEILPSMPLCARTVKVAHMLKPAKASMTKNVFTLFIVKIFDLIYISLKYYLRYWFPQTQIKKA